MQLDGDVVDDSLQRQRNVCVVTFRNGTSESIESDGDDFGDNVGVDDHGDTMHGDYENTNGLDSLNPLDTTDAASILDGDGFSNPPKSKMGSNPWSASYVPKTADCCSSPPPRRGRKLKHVQRFETIRLLVPIRPNAKLTRRRLPD